MKDDLRLILLNYYRVKTSKLIPIFVIDYLILSLAMRSSAIFFRSGKRGHWSLFVFTIGIILFIIFIASMAGLAELFFSGYQLEIFEEKFSIKKWSKINSCQFSEIHQFDYQSIRFGSRIAFKDPQTKKNVYIPAMLDGKSQEIKNLLSHLARVNRKYIENIYNKDK
jgi:hypothetical protein